MNTSYFSHESPRKSENNAKKYTWRGSQLEISPHTLTALLPKKPRTPEPTRQVFSGGSLKSTNNRSRNREPQEHLLYPSSFTHRNECMIIDYNTCMRGCPTLVTRDTYTRKRSTNCKASKMPPKKKESHAKRMANQVRTRLTTSSRARMVFGAKGEEGGGGPRGCLRSQTTRKKTKKKKQDARVGGGRRLFLFSAHDRHN